MGEVYIPEDYLTEALTNRTFDVEATELALRKSLDNSFSYLYRLQRNMVQYEEYHYTTRNVIETPDFGDMWLDRLERVCINFDVQLIPVQDKERFKYSKYFKKEISFKELISEKDIFHRLPVLLIDDKVIRDFKVTIQEGTFTLITPFKRDFMQGKEWDEKIYNLNGTRGNNVYKKHKIDLQIIPNSSVFEFVTNTAMLKRNSYDKNSFNRILRSYLNSIIPDLKTKNDGIYFAVVFNGNEQSGSMLQDVAFNSEGDFVIDWDEETKESLKSPSGVTIRFYFYRYLKKYFWAKGDSLKVRKVGEEKTVSEIALIRNGQKTYDMPVPSENCFMLKTSAEDSSVTLFDQKDIIVKYPNLYHVENNVEENDSLRLYYFYIPGYDLHYEHQYWWFYQYMYLKWGKPDHLTIEEVVNGIYFEDIDVEATLNPIPILDEINPDQQYDYYIAGMELRDEKVHDRWNEYAGEDAVIGNTAWRDYVKEVRWPNTTLMVKNYTMVCALRFRKVFNDLTNIDWMEYRYDDIDYLTNFKDELTPLEYKIFKLKYFIDDDIRCLHDYLYAENKTSIKHHFVADPEELKSRIRTISEVHQQDLGEPMYLFTFEKKHSKDFLSCRIFIDGLMYSNFIRESHGFTDFVYIPTRELIEGCDVDIEIFPAIYEKYDLTFKDTKEVIYLDFDSSEDIIPTLSDLVFYNTEDLFEVYPHENFAFSIVSDRYHYTDPDKKMKAYALVENYSYNESIYYDNSTNEYYKLYANGKVEHFLPDNTSVGFMEFNDMPLNLINVSHLGSKTNRGKGYYDTLGRHYTAEGQPDFDNSISLFLLGEMLENGMLEEIEVRVTNNECFVLTDENYIGYKEVMNGSSILNPENKGVNNTKITRIGIELLNEEMVGKPITVKIEKDSGYVTKQFEHTEFPVVPLNLINPHTGNEFIRVFHNGRLVSKRLYAFLTNYRNPRIHSIAKFKGNDDLFLDITPYRNRLVLHISELTSYLINLKGYIEKPFDLKYYEVYLNGRRLTERNIYYVSPSMFLLGGCHSIYNLDIYEKDRDWEYYACDFGKYYMVSDLVNEIFMEPWIKKELIDSLFPAPPPLNDNCEEKEEYDSDMSIDRFFLQLFYYDRLMPLGLMTADKDQFEDSDIKENFPPVHETYHTEDSEGNHVTFLNPDYYIASEDGDVDKWHVYMLGNNYDSSSVMTPFTQDIGEYGIYIQRLRREQMQLP